MLFALLLDSLALLLLTEMGHKAGFPSRWSAMAAVIQLSFASLSAVLWPSHLSFWLHLDSVKLIDFLLLSLMHRSHRDATAMQVHRATAAFHAGYHICTFPILTRKPNVFMVSLWSCLCHPPYLYCIVKARTMQH